MFESYRKRVLIVLGRILVNYPNSYYTVRNNYDWDLATREQRRQFEKFLIDRSERLKVNSGRRRNFAPADIGRH
jgi:hypothetical protein